MTPVVETAATPAILQAVTQPSREQHLSAIAQGSIPPVIIVIGLPGAGKGFLIEEGLAPGYEMKVTDRLIPRLRRENDPTTEIHWTREQQNQIESWEKVSFAHQPFLSAKESKGWFAIPAASIAKNMEAGKGLVIQVGHPEDVPPLVDAVRSAWPLTPVMALRVMALQEVLAARLMRRPGASAAQLEERLGAVREKAARDAAQAPFVTAYGLSTLMSVTPSELREQGILPEQVAPIHPPDKLKMLVDPLIQRCTECSAEIAADVLTPRVLGTSHPYIPADVLTVLERQIAPLCAEMGINPAIFAGLGAVIYGSPRAVSADIDLTFDWRDEQTFTQAVEFTEELCGKKPELEVYAWDIAPCVGTRGAVFAESGLNRDDAKPVAIDVNVIPSFRAQPESFCFQFPRDQQDIFSSRSVRLSNGTTLALAPPEQILVHKLIMGRGADVEKFDLLDAAALLANCPLDAAQLHKIVHTQKYSVGIETSSAGFVPADGVELLNAWKERRTQSPEQVSQWLEQVGCSNLALRQALEAALNLISAESARRAIPDEIQLSLELSAIKQSVMVSKMCASLARIAQQYQGDSVSNPFGQSQRERLGVNLELVQKVFAFYGLHEIGKAGTVIYVGRPGYPTEMPAFLP